MKNSLGTSIILTLFGESHGQSIGAVLDGMPAGIKVNEEFLKSQLAKRRPNGKTSTQRIEQDNYEILSGVFKGVTTGAPICLLIKNESVRSQDYDEEMMRPSHADYVAHVKYDGHNDYRGGGHFSGRLTAPIVALGSICLKQLEAKGIKLGTHILKCGDVEDPNFDNYQKEIDELNSKEYPLISSREEELENQILKVKEQGDSIGGVLQTAVIGLPVGLGEPWFSSLEGEIANAMFSIGGVKGIEFGKGFGFAKGLGSELNDALYFDGEQVKTKSNNNGGINGGISNGMPVVFNLAVKPTPSIAKDQDSINLKTKENVKVSVKGRHDPAIIRRLPVVINSLLAILLCDELAKRYGVDYLK